MRPDSGVRTTSFCGSPLTRARSILGEDQRLGASDAPLIVDRHRISRVDQHHPSGSTGVPARCARSTRQPSVPLFQAQRPPITVAARAGHNGVEDPPDAL